VCGTNVGEDVRVSADDWILGPKRLDVLALQKFKKMK
jgi:hypothetical protein